MAPSPSHPPPPPIPQAASFSLDSSAYGLGPSRPTLRGERHNSSDDSVSTLSSTATYDSSTSVSTLLSDPGAAELLNEPPRRGCEFGTAGTATYGLERQLEGLGLRDHDEEEVHEHDSSVPPFLRPSPPPTSSRPSLSAIVTSGSRATGLKAPSPISTLSWASSPAVSPSASVFPPLGTSATTIRCPAPAPVHPHRPANPFASLESSSPYDSRRTSLSSSTPSLLPAASSSGYPEATSARAGSLPPGSPPRVARPPSPATAGGAAGTRPSCADTFSTTSTRSSTGRPWVLDSDASSVCSTASSAGAPPAVPGSSAGEKRVIVNEAGREEFVEEGGEVYKPKGDYFLDDRPEPADTALEIDRSDASQVIVRVRLPGFSLDNITVAMRRGHKVHIVADSYGEAGGHYEKLVTLGSDISSAAPRAEFDGTLLRIFIQRRPSRPSSAVSLPGQTAPAPFGHGHGHGAPGSPLGSSMSSSPDLGVLDHSRRPSIASSLASAWSTDSYGSLPGLGGAATLSPSLDAYALGSPPLPLTPPETAACEFDAGSYPPPCTARAGPPPDQKRARCLTGPEGARAAAKAAREEAARRAKEEVKNLPQEARGGRKLPFRRQREEGGAGPAAVPLSATSSTSGSSTTSGGSGESGSSSSAISSAGGTSGSSSPISSDSSSPGRTDAVDRCGTIKRVTSPLPSAPPLRPTLSHQSSGASTIKGSAGDALTTHALETASTKLSEHLDRNPDTAALPAATWTRPKLRANNLTLRPFDRTQSFAEAAAAEALATAAKEGASSPSVSSNGGSATPRREERGMRFTPFST